MQPLQLLNYAIRPAHEVLSTLAQREMGGIEAEVLSLAIALQESAGEHRAQIRGPARSYWQFERAGGFMGVMRHARTSPLATQLATTLDLPTDPDPLWDIFPHNDVLGAGFARLLIYSDPAPLPALGAKDEAWTYYLRTWRPGKPHRDRWDTSYATALTTTCAVQSWTPPEAVQVDEATAQPMVDSSRISEALDHLRAAYQLLEVLPA